MFKGASDKLGVHLNEFRSAILIAVAVSGALLALLVVIEFLLPKEYRTCALMPGFCQKSDKVDKGHFKKLDEGYHGGPKFGLTSGR